MSHATMTQPGGGHPRLDRGGTTTQADDQHDGTDCRPTGPAAAGPTGATARAPTMATTISTAPPRPLGQPSDEPGQLREHVRHRDQPPRGDFGDVGEQHRHGRRHHTADGDECAEDCRDRDGRLGEDVRWHRPQTQALGSAERAPAPSRPGLRARSPRHPRRAGASVERVAPASPGRGRRAQPSRAPTARTLPTGPGTGRPSAAGPRPRTASRDRLDHASHAARSR